MVLTALEHPKSGVDFDNGKIQYIQEDVWSYRATISFSPRSPNGICLKPSRIPLRNDLTVHDQDTANLQHPPTQHNLLLERSMDDRLLHMVGPYGSTLASDLNIFDKTKASSQPDMDIITNDASSHEPSMALELWSESPSTDTLDEIHGNILSTSITSITCDPSTILAHVPTDSISEDKSRLSASHRHGNDNHQLSRWAYETSDDDLTISEKLIKYNWNDSD